MIFTSLEFLYFFVVTTLLFFIMPHRFRWQFMLVASCFFYMFFKPEYILILAFTIIVDYFAGIVIEKEKNDARRKSYLLLSLITNIGVLAFFKYYNFLDTQITSLAQLFGFNVNIPFLRMVLPIGLSFHTFQAMSYTIEVYRGNQRSEKHFGIYALYVMFYPQLVAGPIERPQNILHQLHEKKHFDYDRIVLGLRQMLFGFFKKIVIADRLSKYVDNVYADVPHANSVTVAIAITFFSFQIYCDFSGYSDIALGSAKVLGYDLMKNFDRPYISKNVSEFWRRWHISLSTWFNDYLYTPIIVEKRNWGNLSVVFGLFVTFFISGLWHGAGWTFIVWGLLHAVAVSFEFLTKKTRKKISKACPKFMYNVVSQILTFTFLCFVFVFFRAESFDKVSQIFNVLFSLKFTFNLTQLSAQIGPFNLLLSFGAIFLLYPIRKLYDSKFTLLFSTITFLLTIILSTSATKTFIYFQF